MSHVKFFHSSGPTNAWCAAVQQIFYTQFVSTLRGRTKNHQMFLPIINHGRRVCRSRLCGSLSCGLQYRMRINALSARQPLICLKVFGLTTVPRRQPYVCLHTQNVLNFTVPPFADCWNPQPGVTRQRIFPKPRSDRCSLNRSCGLQINACLFHSKFFYTQFVSTLRGRTRNHQMRFTNH
jgi:hypothetical protein